MAHTYEELKKKTVAELRDIAKEIEHEAVKGYTQLNKEHLLIALCQALAIDTHAHHQVRGLEKTAVKNKIKALKKQRHDALAAHDAKRLADIRFRMHVYKRKIKKALV